MHFDDLKQHELQQIFALHDEKNELIKSIDKLKSSEKWMIDWQAKIIKDNQISIDSLQNTIQAQKKESLTLNDQIKSLQTRIEYLTYECERREKILDGINVGIDKVVSLKNKIAKENALKHIDKKLSQKRRDLWSLNVEFDELLEKKDQLLIEVEERQKKLTSWESDLALRESKVNEKIQRIENYEKLLAKDTQNGKN